MLNPYKNGHFEKLEPLPNRIKETALAWEMTSFVSIAIGGSHIFSIFLKTHSPIHHQSSTFFSRNKDFIKVLIALTTSLFPFYSYQTYISLNFATMRISTIAISLVSLASVSAFTTSPLVAQRAVVTPYNVLSMAENDVVSDFKEKQSMTRMEGKNVSLCRFAITRWNCFYQKI